MNLDQFTQDGKFLMLALDHRGSMKKLINPQDPDSVTDEAVISVKNEIIGSLKDQFSSLLIDEAWGLEACHEVCQVKPFLLPLERSGYTDQAGKRVTELEFSVDQIKKMGASGAKLLVYFNPHLSTAKSQIEIAWKVMEGCKELNFPLFLEIATYDLNEDKLVSGKPGLVIESLRSFIAAGVIPSVWKLEYPGDLESCQEITNMVGDTPWILLTGGDDYEVFKDHLKVAASAGAKGFLAGRALWKELPSLQGEEKEKFLSQVLLKRFSEISQIILS